VVVVGMYRCVLAMESMGETKVVGLRVRLVGNKDR
jgi:hypothetical protein